MKKAFGFTALIILAIVYSVWLPQAKAQAVFGSVLGTVSDPQGAAVAGAKVTVTDQSKGTIQETTTNESGNYTVTHLVPDPYTVRVEAKGFKVSEQKDVAVAADTGVRLDLGLQLGATTESIEVTGEVPQLKTDRADVAVEFNSRAIENLPVLNRNFTNFELLTPGTQKLGWSHAATENPQGGGQIFVNGQHFSGTGFELDGTDNQDPILGIIVINPNLDAVTEAKISTADFDAEFGKAIAGLVTVQTKSGSNELHGSGFYFRRSSAEQARDPFTQWAAAPGVAASPVPSSKWQQFGGSLGGPIIKNKLFFFGDYQGTRQSSGVTNQITIPTKTVLSSCNPLTNAQSSTPGFCNLSDYSTVTNPASGYGTGGQVYDPTTGVQSGPTAGTGRSPFCGPAGCLTEPNWIPINRISPAAANIIALFPQPNNAGSNGGTLTNFLAAGSGPYNQNAFDTRIDFSASSTINVFGRFSLDYFSLSGKGSLGALGGVGFGPGGLSGSSIVHNYSLATGVTKTLSSSLLTDFRFGYFKYNPNTHKPDEGSAPMTAFGIPNANLGDRFTSGLGEFDFNGNNNNTSDAFGDGLGVARCNCPLIESEQQFQFVNNWTKTHGNHTFKFGADIRYAQNLRVPSDSNRTGVYNFTDSNTSNGGVGGVGLASFLLGDVRSVSRYVSTSTNAAERQWRTFYYGEDSWRFTPKLTINLGLRWEIYFPEYVNAKGNGGFTNIVQGVDRVAGFGPYGLNGNIGNDWHAFAPRVGIAYQLREKTVIRMGYGRSYDMGVFGSNFGHAVTQNLPVLAAQFQQNTNQYLPSFTLSAGPPTFTFPVVPSSGQLPLAGTQCTFGNTVVNGVTVAPLCTQPHIRPTSQRLPYVDTWNATVQHQLTRTMSLEVTYLGNKGTHGFVGDGPTYNVNQPGLGAGTLQGCPAACTWVANVPQVQRRPFYNAFSYPAYPDPSNTTGSTPGILQCCFTDQGNYLGNDASSYYNALTVKLDRRFSNGLQFMTFYNYAKGYHYDSNFYVNSPAIAHGPDDNLRNHQWVTSLVYELPFGKGKSFGGDVGRGMDAVIGGWQIAGTMTWAGGLPWTPGLSGAVCNLEQDTGICRPDKGPGSFHIGAGSFVHDARGHYVQYFTPVADVVNPATGVTSLPSGNGFSDPGLNNIGTHGYDSFRGPHYFGADAVLSKNFTLTERAKLQFRMDIYNLFNHPVLGFNQNQGGSGTCIDCSGNGRVTDIESDSSPGSPNGMRQLQFGLRLDF
jgi:outer membrane receptor protein involved in Fe transport